MSTSGGLGRVKFSTPWPEAPYPPHPRRSSRRTDVVASAGATWEVGVFDYRSERFEVGLVDPRSGEVVDIIERPWREGEEPYP
jgi:hypothetical protein